MAYSAEKQLAAKRIDTKYVDVLDGIRAISVIIVMIFHFAQQTWIFPILKTPFLSFIGVTRIRLADFFLVGYLFVDMLVLISGFLLFLPLMRHIFLGEDMADWKSYARRRAARILPSYYLSVLVLFFAFALPKGEYASTSAALRDLFTHLTFTQMLFVDTYLTTKCGVVLWTVAVEVWFYVIFPFIAEAMKRFSRRDTGTKRTRAYAAIAFIFILLHLLSFLWQELVVVRQQSYLGMYINQLPAFLGVYANGMALALALVLISKHCKRSGWIAAISTVASLAAIAYVIRMMNECASLKPNEAQLWQVTERFRLSAAFTVFILSTVLAAKWYRFLFSNVLMRFLAGISYNLYIWHQWLSTQLKYEWRIPYWRGSVPPNQFYKRTWMNKYALVITVAAFAAAILVTYLFEKPASRLILGKPIFGVGSKRSKRRMARPAELEASMLEDAAASGEGFELTDKR